VLVGEVRTVVQRPAGGGIIIIIIIVIITYGSPSSDQAGGSIFSYRRPKGVTVFRPGGWIDLFIQTS
jgi:hypothetical protein